MQQGPKILLSKALENAENSGPNKEEEEEEEEERGKHTKPLLNLRPEKLVLSNGVSANFVASQFDTFPKLASCLDLTNFSSKFCDNFSTILSPEQYFSSKFLETLEKVIFSTSGARPPNGSFFLYDLVARNT